MPLRTVGRVQEHHPPQACIETVAVEFLVSRRVILHLVLEGAAPFPSLCDHCIEVLIKSNAEVGFGCRGPCHLLVDAFSLLGDEREGANIPAAVEPGHISCRSKVLHIGLTA